MAKNILKQQVTPDAQMISKGIDPKKIEGSKAKTKHEREVAYLNVINNVSLQQTYSKGLWIDFLSDLDLRQWTSVLVWKNVPNNIPSWLINHMAYYRGTLAGFNYYGQFYILPWVQNGNINVYGLPLKITPITYNGTVASKEYKKFSDTFECNINNEGNYNEKSNTVIYYTNMPRFQQNNIISPYVKNQKCIEQMADILARVNIQVVITTKKIILKCDDQKQAQSLARQLSKSLNTQSPFVIVSNESAINSENIELQPNSQSGQDLWMHLKGVNDLRNTSNGITNDGFFDKKERKINAETEGSSEQTSIILSDRLYFAELFVESCKIQFKDVDGIEKFTVQLNEQLLKNDDEDIEDEEEGEEDNGND